MNAKIVSNRRISDRYYMIKLSCKGLTGEVRPGQFLMLRVNPGHEPFLRRPFSFYGVKPVKGGALFEILYKVTGFGTRKLAEMKRGENVDILAPLGNTFSLSPDVDTAVLLAGGIGLAPLLFFAEELRKITKGIKIVFLYGGKGKEDIVDTVRIKRGCSDLRIATEDGSVGSKMLATGLLEEYLEERGVASLKGVRIFCCGPRAMLKAVSAIARRHEVPCQMSMENYMACGFGACLGCAIQVRKDKEGTLAYERVCKEGPVFDSERIVWDE